MLSASNQNCANAMKIQLYNTLTNRLENFEPVDAGIVRMYSCGPTVYDFAHIGNFRSFLSADLLRRFFELAGFDVRHIMNITDVGHMTEDDLADGGGEDKMELAARRLREDKKSGKVPDGALDNPDDPFQVAAYYTEAFLEDARTLGLKLAYEYPDSMLKATEQIPEMQSLIGKLIDRGHAYVGKDGVVYYDVASFGDYGLLSGNTLDQLRAGSGGRVTETELAAKRQPEDFLLWKPDEHHLMKWDSPWGTGYPGWHVECSAMALKALAADVIDIHTGGEDLIFPHHECEIAQSRGATGADYFARFWVHARFLMVEGEKMSKSAGNFYTARDVLEGCVTGRPVHPAVLRLELLKSHYRSNTNFTSKGLGDSARTVRRLSDFHGKVRVAAGGESVDVDASHPVLGGFLEALADDLNVSVALSVLFPFIAAEPEDPRVALGVLEKVDTVLGVLGIDPTGAATSGGTGNAESGGGDEVETLCKKLDRARAEKDWGTADTVRDVLIGRGYDVQTTPEGTVARKKLS